MRHDTGVLAAPAEPEIENDLPLDLSCNSARQRDESVVVTVAAAAAPPPPSSTSVSMMMAVAAAAAAAAGRIGGPPSPPRSPVDFRAQLSDTLGYVAYHRHLIALQQQHHHHQQQQQQQQQQVDEDVDVGDVEDDLSQSYRDHRGRRRRRHSADDDDSDDGDESDSPMDLGLGAGAKAYKKSLMKRYRKFLSFLLLASSLAPPSRTKMFTFFAQY